MEHHALGAMLRRSGPVSRRRTLFLFYAFARVRLRPQKGATECEHQSSTTASASAVLDDDDSDTDRGTKLAKACVIFLTHLVATSTLSPPPRFVFAVGPKGAVLRSSDRGHTWRKVTVLRGGTETAAVKCTPPPQCAGDATADSTANGVHDGAAPNADADFATQLHEILNLLPRGDVAETLDDADSAGSSNSDADLDADKDAAAEAEGARMKTTTMKLGLTPQPDLLSIACFSDMVAVCGADGLLALSVDRGVTFTIADSSLLSAVRDRTKSKREFHALRAVRFLSERALVFHTHSSVLVISFCVTSLTSVRFDSSARPLVKFAKGPIGFLETVAPTQPQRSGIGGVVGFPKELWFGTKNLIHWSPDAGATFLQIPHSLGLVRSVAWLPSTATDKEGRAVAAPVLSHPNWAEALEEVGLGAVPTNVAMAQHPAPSADSSSHDDDGNATSTSASQTPKKFSFGIVSNVTLGDPSVVTNLVGSFGCHRTAAAAAATSSCATASMGRSSAAPLAYRRLMILAVDGRVVPYDATGVLHVVLRADEEAKRIRIHTTASLVDYLPFSTSSISDHVGLAVLRREVVPDDSTEAESDSVAVIRSTKSGLSTSHDCGKSWSNPARSYTGACVPLDEGCAVAASLRKAVVITEDYGLSFSLNVFPTELRVATVHDVAVML